LPRALVKYSFPELITVESVVPDCLDAARQARTQDVTTNEAGAPVLVMSCEPVKTMRFPAEGCAACPQRSRCTGSKSGRSVKLHADEKLLQELRVRQGTSAGRATLRERVGVERDLSHIGHWQGERARYCGEHKNLLDLRRCAVVNNLHLFARRPEIMAQAA
jgi:hypothetical protein